MKPHRIFLAVNLPQEVKSELLEYQNRWPELPARWTKPENLHLTLIFYGNASDQELEEIKNKTKETCGNYKPFSLKLSRVVYGPSEKMPRMIWTMGESPRELLELQHELAATLHRLENRPFFLHLTLARLQEWGFQRIDPEDRPEINEDIFLEIPVNSIEIMESKLKRGGAEYTICESISLA